MIRKTSSFALDQVVVSLVNVWIGLTNLVNAKAVYEWVYGSDVSFTNWQPGEPNFMGGSENCTELHFIGLHNRSME